MKDSLKENVGILIAAIIIVTIFNFKKIMNLNVGPETINRPYIQLHLGEDFIEA